MLASSVVASTTRYDLRPLSCLGLLVGDTGIGEVGVNIGEVGLSFGEAGVGIGEVGKIGIGTFDSGIILFTFCSTEISSEELK